MRRENRLVLVSVMLFLALVAWDASDMDMVLAHWSGGLGGFSLRNDWVLENIMHTGGKYLAWAVVVFLCAMVIWPVGALAELPFARRLQLPATALIATAMVAILKTFSATSCPWDLAEFGGVARHVSHWSGWLVTDGGGGHCFPAGHATSGFAFLGGWFALRKRLPTLATWWLACAVAAGFFLGAMQQIRGAHFMSHTLWTAYLCWVAAWLTDPLFGRLETQARVQAQVTA